MKSSTVTTTVSTKTLIETTEQSVIETFDEIGNFLDLYMMIPLPKSNSSLFKKHFLGNGLFARTVKPLRTEVEFQTTQDSIQFQTTGKYIIPYLSVIMRNYVEQDIFPKTSEIEKLDYDNLKKKNCN